MAEAAPADIESGLPAALIGAVRLDQPTESPPPSGAGERSRSRASSRASLVGDDDLILTPAKLRLDSRALTLYVTSMWLMNSIFLALLLFKVCVCVCVCVCGARELRASQAFDHPRCTVPFQPPRRFLLTCRSKARSSRPPGGRSSRRSGSGTPRTCRRAF